MKKILISTLLTLGYGSSLLATPNISSCLGCHGANFEKAALGKSKIVKDLTQEDIFSSLIGYKNGTYGGPMKGVMKGQVARYSDEDLKLISKMIKK